VSSASYLRQKDLGIALKRSERGNNRTGRSRGGGCFAGPWLRQPARRAKTRPDRKKGTHVIIGAIPLLA